MKFKIKIPKFSKENKDEDKVTKGGINFQVEKIFTFWKKIESFSWDFLGLLLIAIALITLLALLDFTKGTLITPWALFLRKWLGFGSFFAAAIVGLVGVLSFRKKVIDDPVKWLWRIVVFEFFLFSLIALFSLFTGRSLERAETGLDGGLIGWGLSELINKVIPDFIAIPVLFVLCVLFLINGFGLQEQVKDVLKIIF